MAQFNENIKIVAPNPIDDRYLSPRTSAGSQLPYSGVTEVYTIPETVRYTGLTVLVESGTSNVEYWFKEGITDIDLVEKKFASEQLVGDFVTGATNLGYFEGLNGLQTLTINQSIGAYNGVYLPKLNWYYRDTDQYIKLGSPTHDGPLRRLYVKLDESKSWIWDVNANGWAFVDDNAENFVGEQLALGTGIIGTPPFTVEKWWHTGGTSNNGYYQTTGLTVNVVGNLYSGSTFTIGNPIFTHKADQDLNLRTIISDTPEFLRISIDENNDNFIRFSGASSVLSGTSVGASVGSGTYDVFTGQTGTTMYFRTLTQSGDTTITQDADGGLTIYSSSDGSANAVTGATNTTGGTGVYSGTTDRNLQLYSLVGSGDTNISQVGDNIVINSEGGGVFDDNILVSIAAGKTFGKYENGDTIPASGKTTSWVILDALAEALDPTLTLGDDAQNVVFGESGKTVNVTFSYVINTAGASPDAATAVLAWRRNNSGSWIELSSNTGNTSYYHTIDDSADRFNDDVINYKYTVVDTGGGSGETTYDVTPQAYATPSMSIVLNGSIAGSESQNIREKGNTDSTPSGTINSTNRPLVNITDWVLERRIDGGSWFQLNFGIVDILVVNVPSTLDTGITSSAVNIEYRLGYKDEYQTTYVYGGNQLISFKYYSYWGFNINTVLNEIQIEALGNKNFLSSVNLTWDNINTPTSNYTYYAYPSTYPDITLIKKNVTVDDTGAWDATLIDVNVTNIHDALLPYRVYRTNATLAYGAIDDIVIT